MKKLLIVIGLIISIESIGQNISKQLKIAYEKFESDSQLSNAISSLYVINAKTGEVVFDKNSRIGLATASTLKIVTAATAYELLGRDFRYETKLGYDGKIENGTLNGNLFIIGNGDPTFGSWRYASTKREIILKRIVTELKLKEIKTVGGKIYLDESSHSLQPIPDGWIWQDIGNYYGAGCYSLNWNENQYDLFLKSGKEIGSTTSIVKIEPKPEGQGLINQIITGPKGSGDNGYIYYAPYSFFGFTSGTIPEGEDSFKISGSLPYPALAFGHELHSYFVTNKIKGSDQFQMYLEKQATLKPWPKPSKNLTTILSPTLDSIIYWFLKKSINLYGEALTKTFGYQKNGFGETGKGVEIIKNFWKEKGIAPTELNIVDGSGLSPLNRVTTHAQVMVLKYAKNQPWFNGYYDAFPEFNGMKMKSGTISDVKGFCGYQKSKGGNEYIFSFLVNNYNGSSSSIVQKMYKVLDELK